MNTRFGGVPIGVPIPPILAAKATLSINGTPSCLSLAWLATARATGNSIRVVAVFDIHMLSVAAVTINPSTSCLLLVLPNRLTINNARRRCAPLRSIVLENRRPPSNNRISGLP